MKKLLWLGLVLFLELICLGCGETFRPIIIPNPPQFPNPAASNTVISVNRNAPNVIKGVVQPEVTPGSAMVIDVSGDTVVSEQNVGLAPVHAVQQTASVVLVVNQSTEATPQDSLSKETFSNTVINNTTTIALPLSYTTNGAGQAIIASGQPNFVATTESTEAYVLIPQYQPDTSGTGPITPIIAVVSTSANQVTHTIPVGNSPVALSETPDGTKLYVANNADNTVNGFNTSDRTQRAMVGTFTAPIWINARSDSQRVYVLNGNGVISTVDTTSTAGPDNVIDASITVPGANYMLYDGNENRLYIPAGTNITILDVSQSIPSIVTGAPIPVCSAPNQTACIPTAPPSLRSSTDPCSVTTPTTLNVVSVASLPDMSRAYIGGYYTDSADNICPQVTEFDAVSNTVATSIPIPGYPDATNSSTVYYVPACASTRDMAGPTGSGFRFTMAAGGDSSRAYFASCDGGAVNIIDTPTESYGLSQLVPLSARPPINGAPQNPPQNPIFMLAGPP